MKEFRLLENILYGAKHMDKFVLSGIVVAVGLVAFPPLFDLPFHQTFVLVSIGFLLLVAEILYVRGEIARGRDEPGKIYATELVQVSRQSDEE